MKSTKFGSYFLFVVVIFVFLIADNYSPVPPQAEHKCRWDECPYKGILPKQFDEAVRKYSECEEGTDCYIIDILHLQNPTLEYEELEKMLFDIK